MDKDVIAAMARWPDVPEAYGWLSLSLRGQWRLHTDGDAQQPGDPIENRQIQHFINRNYGSDATGRWFFQNGPQRVFVQLEAAPFVLHTMTAPEPSLSSSANPDSAVALCTHTGLEVSAIQAWWLDDAGRLYAQTEHGGGLIAGRDLQDVLNALITNDGAPLDAALEEILRQPPAVNNSALQVRFSPHLVASALNLAAAPFNVCNSSEIPTRLGFIRNPAPAAS